MYQNKLVIAIKVGGRILRESGGSVQIPFGSEYSVYLKNLNAVRSKFKLSIDGSDATSDTWIVIPANSAVEMERFIKDGDWERGRRFKFIERTAEIEAHRGVKADDGLVRVEFQVERVRLTVDVPNYRYFDVPVPRPSPWYPPRRRWNDVNWTSNTLGASGGLTFDTTCSTQGMMDSCIESGITVAGSESHQKFVSVSGFETGPSEVLVLQLRGVVAGKAVEAPLTVDVKLTCASCGKTSKGAEFCSRCGTALVA